MKKRILSLALVLALLFGLLSSLSFASAEEWEDVRLRVWYPLAGDAKDASRYGNHGTLSGTGARFTNDATYGSVLDLSGGSKGISAVIIPGSVGADLRQAGSITVATWVYYRASTAYTRIYDFGRNSTYNFYEAFRHSGTGATSGHCVKLTTSGSGGEQTIWDSAGQIPLNKWVHVAATFDSAGKVMKLYRDGQLLGTTATASTIDNLFSATASGNLLYIGRSQYGDSDANCKISDFRVYDAALSVDEINQVRNFKFTDDGIASNDLATLVASLGVLENRTANFTLPTSTLSGSTVLWTSSNNTYLNAGTGVVTRPETDFGTPMATVTLTIKVTKGEAVKTQDLTVTIPKLPTDAEVVASDKEALTFDSNILRENITLPSVGLLGSAITWATGNAGVLTAAGVVTRPDIGQPDAAVTLTATIRHGAAADTKTFDFTVKALTLTPVLIGVPRVAVVTRQGILPRIPFNVPGTYARGVQGDPVRVNWDCPTATTAYANTGVVTQTKTAVRTSIPVKANVFVVSKDSFANVLRTGGDYDVCTDVTTADGKYIGNVYMANESAANVRARIVFAVYDAEGRFVELKTTAADVASKGSAKANTDALDLPAGYTAKVFTWNDADMVPLAEDAGLSGTPSPSDGPSLVAQKFDLADVRLTNYENGNKSIFQQNMDNMCNELLSINPDTYLYTFRYTFDLMNESPAGTPAPTSWDSYAGKLKGHGTGHVLSGLAQVYESLNNDDPRKPLVLQRMNYMVDELYKISKISRGDPAAVPPPPGKTNYEYRYLAADLRRDFDQWGEGYISSYPPDQFIMLERGANYDANESSTTTIWAPYYTLHKLMNGFLNIYTVAGNEKGLEMAKGMGLWVYKRLGQLTPAQLKSMWDKGIAGEYGGMNEVMATLYALTGDERYLETAKLFDNVSFFFGGTNGTTGLAQNVDTIRGRHANQHIPQITGALKIYDGTKDNKYYDISSNFWYMVKECYAYSIGGVGGRASNYEAFPNQPNVLLNGTGGSNGGCLLTTSVNSCESCGMYNLLKLSTQLFLHDTDVKYMDYYEQTLYNGIAGGIAKNGAANTYPNPLYRGAAQSFSSASTGSTCCGGTARESHTKYGDSIYFKSTDDSALYVNLFIPSTLQWHRATGAVNVTQVTNYPYGDTIKLNIDGSGTFDVKLRVPSWAVNGYTVTVNGTAYGEGTPGSYMSISRSWTAGDVVEIKMPLDFRYDKLNEDTNVRSIVYGPVIMCASETAASATLRKIDIDGADIDNSVSAFDKGTLTATISGVTFRPYTDYRANTSGTGSRKSVYLDVTALD